MNDQFLSYGVVELLNVPHAKYIADEVIRDDCYDLKRIPDGSVVIDLGAFYGEFSIYCAKVKKCQVVAIEASLENWRVLSLNLIHNCISSDDVRVVRAAISNQCGTVEFSYNAGHPAGSKIGLSQSSHAVESITLSELISTIPLALHTRSLVVKMDIEGAEKEVFESIGEWSPVVSIVSMEWHNNGGEFYRDALIKHGFQVTLRTASSGMGFIYASK